MIKVFLTKGLPASGKSTWAKKLIAENPNSYKRINKDDLRAMLDDSKHSNDSEKFILQVRDAMILMAIENGNITTMRSLSNYYKEIKEYEKMKKYLLMAIEKDDVIAIENLANYYEEIENYDEMIKYYLIAIEKGDTFAMVSLGKYYVKINDYDNMKKYFLMAIEKEDFTAMVCLGLYYNKIEDYDEMEKYLLMAINKGISTQNYLDLCIYYLYNYYYIHKKYKLLESISLLLSDWHNKNPNLLFKEKDTIIYDYIYKYNHNIKECIVCYDTKINIKYKCGHDICLECYANNQNKICYYRCNI